VDNTEIKARHRSTYHI